MIDHVLGRPSVKSRRLQVLAVLAFWSAYLFRGHKHGPPFVRFFSRFTSSALTTWQTVVLTMMYLYAARNFSTLVGIASPEPMANMYDATYFRATWVLTALDAGFWTAMRIRTKWLRDIASIVFSLFYLIAAEQADEKVRKVRGMLTVEHLRVSWNKGTTPYLGFFQNLLRPRFSRWPPREMRIRRPPESDYKDPVVAWLYYDGPVSDLKAHNKVILDIPGGGFVAMNPRTNDDKLLSWATKTGLPVLSLDYKKAPEYPYPYALNECFDVYTTIVRSCGTCIGMSGNEIPHIVVTGDSAGGNLATAMTLMIIESGTTATRRFHGQIELPPPDGLLLFYPALDVNIGNWMSDEQMSLINDRRFRGTNRAIVRRKSAQYNDLVGTPHHSDDEDDGSPKTKSSKGKGVKIETNTGDVPTPPVVNGSGPSSPHPEFSHALRESWNPPSPLTRTNTVSSSHHAAPLRTRLAMSSMISYFNDRVLTPEMMRAMIILYIGPHNRPDFSTDYLLSPVLAPESLLTRFPKTIFCTGERDPLVDDTVIFAGRMRRAKRDLYIRERYSRAVDTDDDDNEFDEMDVAEVVLLPGVSHGFLQFPTVYPPAWKLFTRCAGWINNLFRDAEMRATEVERNMLREKERKLRERERIRAAESSEDERPLEIAMTKMRNKKNAGSGSATGGGEKPVNGVNGLSSGDEAKSRRNGRDGGDEELESASKKERRKIRVAHTGQDLKTLKSSEDLLGRRMHGVAGGLTGLTEDD